MYLSVLLDASPPASPFTTAFTLSTTITLHCIRPFRPCAPATYATSAGHVGRDRRDKNTGRAKDDGVVAHHQYALPKRLGGVVVHCIANLPATLSIASSCTTNESSRVTLRTWAMHCSVTRAMHWMTQQRTMSSLFLDII